MRARSVWILVCALRRRAAALRHHWGDPDGLGAAIRDQAHALNSEFSEPLPAREVDQIAASIHRWIITRSRMWADGSVVYEATFSTIQSARGRRSGEARRAAAQTRWGER